MDEQALSGTELKNSPFGVASFAISIAGIVLLVLTIATSAAIHLSTPGGIAANPPAFTFIGISFFGVLIAESVAGGLGIAGVLQEKKKRTLAILGICFSAGVIIAFFCLIIGMALLEPSSARTASSPSWLVLPAGH